MAQCPHCQWEYVPSTDRAFCADCGLRLDDSPAVTDPALITDPDNVKVQGVGEGNTAGRDVIVHQQVQLMYCAYGGEQV